MNPRLGLWVIGGNLLLALHGALVLLSPRFAHGIPLIERPAMLLAGLLFIGGLLWLVPLAIVRTTPHRPWLIAWVLAAGLLMRLVQFPATPMLEDDFYRYLWDGAVVAHGHNPYAHAPQPVQDATTEVPDALVQLGEASGAVLERVNHPELATVYPPVAQAVFALAHALAPWSPLVLKALYLVADCAGAALLLWALHLLGRSPLWLAVYWWNPLLIKEGYNSLHMDVLLVPLLAGVVVLALRQRHTGAAAVLALAIGTKLWPVLIAPWLLRVVAAGQARRVVLPVCVLGALSVLLFAPMLTRPLDTESGLAQYAARWEMNDALFMVFPWLAERLAALCQHELSAGAAHRAGRIVAALLVGGVALWAALRPGRDAASRVRGLVWVPAALFLLSPTQFPWYLFWVVPLLTLAPRPSLLLLTPMLAVYYLKFHYAARGEADFFHYTVVWFEYAPVWLLLLTEGVWTGRTRATSRFRPDRTAPGINGRSGGAF